MKYLILYQPITSTTDDVFSITKKLSLPKTLIINRDNIDYYVYLLNDFIKEESGTLNWTTDDTPQIEFQNNADFLKKDISKKQLKEIATLDVHKYFPDVLENQHEVKILLKKDFLLKPLGSRNDYFYIYILAEFNKLKNNEYEEYLALFPKFLKTIQQFDRVSLTDKEQRTSREDAEEIMERAIKKIMEDRDLLSDKQINNQVNNLNKTSGLTLFQIIEEEFCKDYKDFYLYIKGERGENSEVYQYKQGYFQFSPSEEMESLIATYIKNKNLYQYNKSSTYIDIYKRIKLHMRTLYKRSYKEKDIDKNIINLKNGLFDIKTRELLPHSNKYFSLNQLPFEYDETATCPMFEKHIETVSQGDDEIKRMLQQMFGYVISPGNPRHKLHILYGQTARNGKSVTTKILSNLLGENNTSFISLQGLSGQNAHDLANIENKILNISDEGTAKYIESPAITSMTAEGTIEINRKFTQSYPHKVTTNFIINANDVPRFSDGTGISNRVIIIPFTYQIPEKDRIPLLDEKISEKELAGVFNWALVGAKDVQENGFFMSEKSKEEKDNYDRDNNSVYAFLTERCVVEEPNKKQGGAEIFINNIDLYGSKDHNNKTGYNAYCSEYGVKPLSNRMFFKEVVRIRESYPEFKPIERIIKKISGKTQRGYLNLKLVEEVGVTEVVDGVEVENEDFKF